tara:strand:- start:139 stop:825 length:687 start_codon:yes stop_codon:yes gene_type:complete
VKKLFGIIFFITIILILFHDKLIEKYLNYKLSKWVEKDIIFKEFSFEYPNLINIKGLNIINSKPINYVNIFESDEIYFNIDLKSYFLNELVIINNLVIENPNFYLELVLKNTKFDGDNESKEKVLIEDNIGVAKKINEKLPDKIWPTKKKDKNFLILKSFINNGTAFIKISSIKEPSKISLSSFEFSNIGNQKGFQHYKDILKIIFFDICGREPDLSKKKILKEVYKF